MEAGLSDALNYYWEELIGLLVLRPRVRCLRLENKGSTFCFNVCSHMSIVASSLIRLQQAVFSRGASETKVIDAWPLVRQQRFHYNIMRK